MTEPLRESGHSRTFGAVAERDGRQVVAKVVDIASEADEARVQHEFELIRSLDIEGVVRAESLQRVGDQLVLILERAPGVDLRELVDGGPLALPLFFQIAGQISEILAKTHARRVIHRDIKPANLLFDSASGRAHVADFGISVLLESERRHIYDDQVLIGTLPYISPEQTGRTNRAVDFRSDLYSLGVTFYELLTGRRPFELEAPLELIHAHLARTPDPPRALRAELPEALSRLVMKLLAKAPEHRYQTAAGLAADLRELQRMHERGCGEADFELGQDDRSAQLQLPHQLYGRTRELAELRAQFDEIVESGGRRTTLLAGPAGVGKSSLLDSLAIAAVGLGGLALRGKFDRYHELPYSAFVDAFTALFEQLLTQSDALLTRWRRRLISELGGLVSTVCELIPTLTLIVGRQDPAPELGPIEARNRLQVAIERLFASLCEYGPVVLTLDDVHAADHGSVALLDTLVSGTAGPLLITGTLRDDELAEGHPLLPLLQRFETELPQAQVMRVGALGVDAVEGLLRDALGRTSGDLRKLAAIVTRKTGGVPLFVGQLVTRLAAEGQLAPTKAGWGWDPKQIEAAQLPDDAVEMMRARLDALAPAARELLGRAACLGARFGLAELALVSGREPGDLVASSFALIEAGLVVGVGSVYQFAHGSIQIAAQELLDPAETRRARWRIGRHLLETLEGPALDERLFELVDHLAAGAPASLGAELCVQIARLALRAGERALDAAAYDLALRYVEHGLELLAQGEPGDLAELEFGLSFGRAQALALGVPDEGQRERANAAFEALLARELDHGQFGRVVALRIRLLHLDNRPREALALGRGALERLGAALPAKVSLARGLWMVTLAWLAVRKLDREAAMAIPACEDPRSAAIVAIVAWMKYPAFVVDNDLFVYLSGLHVRLLGEHGFHDSTPVAISDLSIAIAGGLDKPDDAQRMIDLAMSLCERTTRPEVIRCNVIGVGGAMGWHRTRPYADFLHELEHGYVLALELGEFDQAGFMAGFEVDMRLEVGTHLAVLDRQARELAHDLGRRGVKQMAIVATICAHVCAELLGERAARVEAGAGDEAEVRGLARLSEAELLERGGVSTNIYTAHANAALVQLVLGDYAAALETSMRGVADVAEVLFNSWIVPRMYLVHCVSVDAQRMRGQALPPGAEAQARKALKLLRSWARAGPGTYGHYVELALGVQAAARGRLGRAVGHLDRAWSTARARGCRWVEGLAAEFVAEVLERRGTSVLVEGARRRAWDAYSAWGAEAKLERMRTSHPAAFAEPTRGLGSSSSTMSTRLTVTPGSSTSQSLDLEVVLRSVGIITEQLQLDEVVVRVLDAALTSAGADHGLLLLERGGELRLVATAAADQDRAEVLPRWARLRELGERAPASIVNFVVRTGKSLVIDDAGADPRFAGDPYVARHEVRSLLVTPIARNSLLGVLVLENRLRTHGFRPATVETLRMITNQAASTLDNARLYAALGRSEARWRSLVASAPDVIALLDDRGELAFVNHGELDDSFVTALTPGSHQRWRAAVDEVLASGRQGELELELLPGPDSAGQPRWFAVRLAAIELDDEDDHELDDEDPGRDDEDLRRADAAGRGGPRRNAIAVATDISDRKRAEVERQQLESQLRQQQRLESLGTLASGVAHEINNPVQGIMNYAELISSNPDDKDMIREFAGEIAHETERVATIVRNLLAFSRQERDQAVEDAEVTALIQGTLSLIKTVLRKDQIAIELQLPPLRVRCRVQQVQQIIMNLVTNARDALNGQFSGYDERKRIEIRAQPHGESMVRITVEDSGGGIPAEVLTHIFDPFFTTKGRDKGTGLGLSVSHGIAQDNGGELSVETSVGVGTCFHLDLPRAP